jgi:hypothetical protein
MVLLYVWMGQNILLHSIHLSLSLSCTCSHSVCCFLRSPLSRRYSGPTLLEAIDAFQPANRAIVKPSRFIGTLFGRKLNAKVILLLAIYFLKLFSLFPVSDVNGEGRGVVARGRVLQGFIQVGDRSIVLQVGDAVVVSRLQHLQAPSS